MSARETTVEILEALQKQHENSLWASELAFDDGARRCDFWSIHAHASKGFLATAYEIKVSRSDFKRDTFDKQRQARLFSDRFFYVCPKGMVAREDVPDWAGLMEYEAGKLTMKLPAPRRDKDLPTWQLVVSLIRNSGEIHRDGADLVRRERNDLKRRMTEIERKLREEGLEPWRFGII